jgi:hypothetical protein
MNTLDLSPEDIAAATTPRRPAGDGLPRQTPSNAETPSNTEWDIARTIGEHPAIFVGAALAAGVVLGCLIKR